MPCEFRRAVFMRGARLYSLLFWISWGVISLVAQPEDRDSSGFAIATFLG